MRTRKFASEIYWPLIWTFKTAMIKVDLVFLTSNFFYQRRKSAHEKKILTWKNLALETRKDMKRHFWLWKIFAGHTKCSSLIMYFGLGHRHLVHGPTYNYNTAWATRCLGDCKFAYMWLTENSSGARVFSSPHVGKLEIS